MSGSARVTHSRRRPTHVVARPRQLPRTGHTERIGAGVVTAGIRRGRDRWPEASHIPRYLVLPAVESQDHEGPIPVVGAHRFRVPPTPVLGASLSLLGLPAVATACRPFKTVAQRYHCARFLPGAAVPGGSLRTGRFPKV